MSRRLSLFQIIVAVSLLVNTGGALVEAAPRQDVTSPQPRQVILANETVPPADMSGALADTWTVSFSIASCQDSITRIFLPLVIRGASGVQSVAQSQAAFASQLPGSPQDVAPPLDRSVSYDLYEATRFLYTGSNPVQTGVAPDVINPRCVAVLRGNVLTRDREPLPGASISIKDRPEFGQTLSRADGLFDFVLNGGETVIVEFQKAGYLPVQRRVVTQRRQFETVEPVVLIQPDAQATAIDPTSTADFQVARGSVVSDTSGARQATLLFPQGAFTSVVSAQGALHAAAQLTVRATEYTVGTAGAAAMPGDLPPNSGYTYAVEFSVDEAGQSNVTFDKPVINYTENLITAPVGSAVPAAYYDRDKGEWIPSKNGRVIKILSINAGMADLDVTGDGVADTGQALADLGVTDAERQQLAGLYSAGQELWRVELPHFSPWDFNWPFGPPPDAQEPPGPDDVDDQPNPCSESGSIIDCDAQSLGEFLPVIGTPFTLNYTTRRVPGWKVSNYFDIPITVGEPPTTVKTISLYAEVAGQLIVKRWSRYGVGNPFGVPGMYTGTIEAIAPNLTYRLVWNGQDGYNRATNGRPMAHIELRYVYDYTYYTARSEFEQSFGQFGDELFITSGREYCEYLDYPPAAEVAFYFCGINLIRNYARPLGYWDAAAGVGLGGWTLDVHHAYDPNDGTLHLGDGTDLRNSDIGPIVSTVVDDPQINYMGDFTIAPDGTIFFYDGFERHIVRVRPGQPLEIYAGNGSQGMPTGDGGPATAATLGWAVNGLAVGPDGSLYIAGTYDNFNVGFVRRVTPDGIIQTIAGVYYTDSNGANGDGGPAIAARLNKPEDILVGPDGSLYIAETPLYRYSGGNYNRIRKITNGIITTIAGAGGDFTANADLIGIPALNWGALPAPGGMTFGPDGSLYVTHPGSNTLSRITPDGVLRRVAGSGASGNAGDGGTALAASLSYPQSVAVDENGVLYVRTRFGSYDRVRRIMPDGIITTYAGRDCTGPQSNNGLSARQACISNFISNNSLVIAPDGTLLLNPTRGRIERIGPPVLPENALGQTILIPASNGSEVYEFSSLGRHLRTLNALTGATLYRFGYDAAGRLTSVTDYDGNITQIERAADGKPTAIVAPGGQRTTLALNAGGYLSAVTNPANETTGLTYKADGLLETLTDARGGVHHLTYDGDGRLIRDEDPAGGIKTLARLEEPGRTVVTVTTGLNRTTLYATEVLTNSDRLRSVTAPDGTTTRLLNSEGSVWTLTAPDGTTQRITYTADPRWGMSVPLAASVAVTTPDGLSYAATAARTATLTQPANPFSMTGLQERVTVNGKTWQYTFSSSARTMEIVSPEGRHYRSVLDAAGRLVSTNTDASGALAPITLTYDARGRLTQLAQAARAQQFGYSAANWLTSHTAPDGSVAYLSHDPAGRVISATLPGGRAFTFAYDAGGNLTGLTPPGKSAHSFSYNAVDLPLSYTPPAVTGGGNAQWAYDADHNLTTFTRPDGGTLGLTYIDNGFHLDGVTLPRGERALTYDSAGRIQSLSDPSGITLTYDYDGPLVVRRMQSGPVAGTVEFAYTLDWLVGSIRVNGAYSVTLRYDNDDLLRQSGDLLISRNASNGLVTGSQLGSVSDAWAYNTYAEAISYTAAYNGAPLYRTDFERDVRGRITRKVEIIGGVTSTFDYTYDVAGRLRQVRKDGTLIGDYVYDANGNRLSADSVSATYDAQDRLVQFGQTSYAYTAAGELASQTTGSATTTYQYDAAGNLLAVTLPDGTQITYLVDALNRRVGKRVNGVLVQGFLYEGSFRPIAELDGSGAVVSRFVYGSRSNVPAYLLKGGQTYRIIADQLGSPRLVVNVATGQIAQRLDYDAWGKVLQDSNPGFQPFGFAGGLYDRDTGLVRFGLRDYDPIAGRWTNKDPFGFAGGDSNLYAYVSNDPVNAIDPTGTEEESAPSPCNPDKPWDEKIRDGLDNLKKAPNWSLPKPLKWLKDGYNKLTKAEKFRDDVQKVSEDLRSPDPYDTLDAVETGLDYVPQEVPITPIEAVKETIRQAKQNLKNYLESINPPANSSDQRLSDRHYAMFDAERN
ncbi:MAG TPA: RHS repeat-associated core domain-containing protein [Anaerolineae bacterium]|nr:RHS repeat-associated core domain-containing protein [Anaerolineae bacterium]HQI85652.1 RHS repeat-associated core domain-containing protein [Anaerolineae bacterium]